MTFTVQYAEDGQDTTTDTIVCRMAKASAQNSAGSDPTKITSDLKLLMPIKWNGVQGESNPSTVGLVVGTTTVTPTLSSPASRWGGRPR